jgi:hypothetical protein
MTTPNALDITQIAELAFGVHNVTLDPHTPNQTLPFELDGFGNIAIKEVQGDEIDETHWYLIQTMTDTNGCSESEFLPGCDVDTGSFSKPPDELGVAEELFQAFFDYFQDKLEGFYETNTKRLAVTRRERKAAST